MVERIEERLGNPERCPHGWPIDPAFEQAENKELAPLADLKVGQEAEIVRLAEHDGELLHWFYDEGFTPGAHVVIREAQPAAAQFKVLLSEGRASDRREGSRRPLRAPRGTGLAEFLRQAARIQMCDRLDRDHRIDARGGGERGAVRDHEVPHFPGLTRGVRRRQRRRTAHARRTHDVERIEGAAAGAEAERTGRKPSPNRCRRAFAVKISRAPAAAMIFPAPSRPVASRRASSEARR